MSSANMPKRTQAVKRSNEPSFKACNTYSACCKVRSAFAYASSSWRSHWGKACRCSGSILTACAVSLGTKDCTVSSTFCAGVGGTKRSFTLSTAYSGGADVTNKTIKPTMVSTNEAVRVFTQRLPTPPRTTPTKPATKNTTLNQKNSVFISHHLRQ